MIGKEYMDFHYDVKKGLARGIYISKTYMQTIEGTRNDIHISLYSLLSDPVTTEGLVRSIYISIT